MSLPLDPVLRLAQVEASVGLRRSMIYKLMGEGSFPQPVRLSVRAVGWRASDVANWLESRAVRAA